MTNFEKPILVLGKGCDQSLISLADEREEYFERADLILAPSRWLPDAPQKYAPKLRRLDANPDSLLDTLDRAVALGHKILILANGDPMFYGIGSTLAKFLPDELFSIISAPGCLQTLAARLKLPTAHFASVSLHGRSDLRPLADAANANKPVCALTGPDFGPDLVARYLLDRGATNYDCVVGENLGETAEKISRMDLAACGDSLFAANSTLFLLPREMERARESLWLGACRSKPAAAGAALEALALERGQILWDIGAGSGAIAIMASKIAGEVFALEKQPERALDIQLNRARERATNVNVVLGEAPLAARALPTPRSVFIGGGLSSDAGDAILSFCLDVLPAGGRLVATCVLLETLGKISTFAKAKGLILNARQIFSSVLAPLGGGSRFKPENAAYIATIEKK